MHRRHQHINIPTEIIRTVVSIAETGSFSKAGEKLKLGQPAVSAQIKRLQLLVGGPVFEKAPGGVAPTARGRQILTHARKLIDANDQILSIGGAMQDKPPLRLGLSAMYVDRFLARWGGSGTDSSIHFICDHSPELARGLTDGYVDIACLMNPPAGAGELVESWAEPIAWVRSKDFVLSPGAPIPLATWPGGVLDRSSIEALESAGLNYRIVFASADHDARVAAVAAGVALMVVPARKVPEALVVANEYYLPPLAPLPAGIVMRPNGNDLRAEKLIDALRIAVAPHEAKPVAKPVVAPVVTPDVTPLAFTPTLMAQSKSMRHR